MGVKLDEPATIDVRAAGKTGRDRVRQERDRVRQERDCVKLKRGGHCVPPLWGLPTRFAFVTIVVTATSAVTTATTTATATATAVTATATAAATISSRLGFVDG